MGDDIKGKAIANKRALDGDEGNKNSSKSFKLDAEISYEEMAKGELNNLDPDVSLLIGEEPGVLLRREQLNANFRDAAGDDEEDDEGNGEGDDGEKPVTANKTKKPGAKGKAKCKATAAKSKPKPVAKGKAKAKTTKGAKDVKPKKADVKAKGKSEEKKSEEKKSEEEPKSKETKTFARRYTPTDPIAAARHTACRSVYEAEIAPKMTKQSSFQAGQV